MLILFLSNIYFNSLLLTKQCFTPILAYRRSSVVVNRSEKIFMNKINGSKTKIKTNGLTTKINLKYTKLELKFF